MNSKPPSDALFAGILSIAADAIISIDQDRRITLFNHGAETIFGYPAEEVIGESLDILLPERFRAAHDHHITSFQAAPEAARRMGERREIRELRKNGEEFYRGSLDFEAWPRRGTDSHSGIARRHRKS